MRPRTRRLVLLALPLAAALSFAPAARATFHEMSIREVYPGSGGSPGAEYVELQMWAGGQNLVGGHVLRTYGPTGVLVKSNEFPADVASGANQSTVLMATSEAEAQFGVLADGALSPADQLDPAGGAVCWESIDCVSWGSFSGSLPSPAGSPAASGGIPDGMALRRTISPGCPTFLESGDDSDDSAADFSLIAPTPRPNSVAPTEIRCAKAGEDGSGSPSGGAPQTVLRRKPPKRTHDRTPTFRFSSNEPGSTFQCRLDRKAFRACRSPFTAKRLSLGRHVFRVRARDDSGRFDPTPAVYRFRVVAAAR